MSDKDVPEPTLQLWVGWDAGDCLVVCPPSGSFLVHVSSCFVRSAKNDQLYIPQFKIKLFAVGIV